MDALKRSISELIFPKKNWKGIKTIFFKISVTTYIYELLDLGAEITVPNSALCYQNLPRLLPGFLHTYATDLAEMGSLSSYNWSVEYLVYVIDVFTINGWVKPLRDKKAKTVLHDFNEIVNESKRKTNKLWVDQRKEFYNSLVQIKLNDNNILMYWTHNEDKSVVAESFLGTLKTKIYKKITANDKKSYRSYL